MRQSTDGFAARAVGSRALVLAAALVVGNGLALRGAAAQPAAPLRLTLADMVRRGVDSSLQVGEVSARVRRANAQLLQARASGRPQVTTSALWQWNVQNQFQSLVPSGATPGTSTRAPSAADPLLRILGADYQLGVGAAVSQRLFDGGRQRAMVQAAAATATATLQAEASTRAATMLSLVDAYASARLADLLQEYADSAVAHAERVVQQTDTLWRTGVLAEYEHLRARLVREDVAVESTASLELIDSLEVMPTFLAPLAARPVSRALDQARWEVSAAESQSQAVRAQRWPSLAVQSSYQRFAYPTRPFPQAADPFLPQFTVGFGVTHGGWTGGRWAADRALAQANVDAARVRLQCVEQQLTLRTREAELQEATSSAAYRAGGTQVAMAQRTLAIAEVRLREGMATAIDVSDVRRQLYQALASRSRAARDVLLARVRLALLPDLPVVPSTDSPCVMSSR
jgi:outer membrane protein TolC